MLSLALLAACGPDAHATVNPDADEVCDGVDNDCDGAIDDEPTGASNADADYGPLSGTLSFGSADARWLGTNASDSLGYASGANPDTNGDGTDSTDYHCDGSVGYVDADGSPGCADCDDTDAARSPEAAEVCDEAHVDEDCDGLSVDAGLSPDAATWNTWYADRDWDTHGGASRAVFECGAPPVMASAHAADTSGAAAGAIFVFTDPASGAAPARASATILGDGKLDLLIGSTANDDAASNARSVWLVYGPLSGTLSFGSADARWLGTNASDSLRYASGAIPDTNGDDGTDELAMGAYFGDERRYVDHGAVWIWLGE